MVTIDKIVTKTKSKKAVKAAQKRLLNNPYDIYHDINHHSSVWNNCLTISFNEKLSPNFETLEIAAWWHDVFRDKDYLDKLSMALNKSGLGPCQIKEVVSLVGEHSFGKKQTSIETNILYDADKLELVSIPRFKYASLAYEQGLITIEERERYTHRWNEIIEDVENTLHYKFSKSEFKNRLENFLHYLDSIDRNNKERFSIVNKK